MDYQIEKQITENFEKVLAQIKDLRSDARINVVALQDLNKNQITLQETMGSLKEEFQSHVKAIESWSETVNISMINEKKRIDDRFSLYESGMSEGMADFVGKINSVNRKLERLEESALSQKDFEQWQDNGLATVLKKIEHMEVQLEELQSSSMSKESFRQWQEREGYNKFNSLVENFFSSLVKLDWRIWVAAGFVAAIATGLIGVEEIVALWDLIFGGS